jgi:hypothetical protein
MTLRTPESPDALPAIPEKTRPLLNEFKLQIQANLIVYETLCEVIWRPLEASEQTGEVRPQEERKPFKTRIKFSHKIPVKEWSQWYRSTPEMEEFRENLQVYLSDFEKKAAGRSQQIQEEIDQILDETQNPSNLKYLKPGGQHHGAGSKDLWDVLDRGYPNDLVGEDPISPKSLLNRIDALWHKIKNLITQGQLDAVASKIGSHPEYQIKKKSLRQKFTVDIPVGSSVMSLKNEVITQLSNQDLKRMVDLTPDQLVDVFKQECREPVENFKNSIEEQVKKLLKKIRKLPHADLLSDHAIVETIKPYFTRQEEPFRKRHARDALVAVEEKAREAKYRDDVFRLEEHRAEYADVARYYPIARQLQRKLILYVGPTNSGKTWRALNDLAEGQSGAYLAPLRLLALEGQEELEKRGKLTSYITGEEREIRPEATFVSSTIEMMDFDRIVDRVVIDEVQLLADERRGWAWLAAFVGAPASRVIMTGSPDCVALVRWLASYLGEELEIVECQRYNELRIAEVPAQLHQLQPATAVVCFSRRDVLLIKSQIEETSKHRVAVVYGNLSPQVRREEARRFRSGEADILVATDAIAMGLNLPIHQVVFFKTEKFDGESTRPLTMSEIRQIGGRAGRYGFAQFGLVSALTPQALGQVRFALRSPQKPL